MTASPSTHPQKRGGREQTKNRACAATHQPLLLHPLHQAATASAGPPITHWRSNATNPCTAHPKWYPRPGGGGGAKAGHVDLAGRVAVVTGASRGVGAALAAALAGAGVTVLGTSRTPASYPSPPCELLALDVTSPTSVAAFAAGVAAHPAVAARGGLDILINNAGRLVLGGPLVEAAAGTASAAAAAWEADLWEGMETNYVGPARVTVALWPLLAARAAADPAAYARLVFTLSPLAWAAGSRGGEATRFLFGYTASQRAAAGYANNLRAGAATVGSPVKVSTASLMATATGWAEGGAPIFLGAPPPPAPADPAFSAFLADLRAATAAGMDPAGPVAAAFLDLLREADPTANVAVGGPAGGPPGAPHHLTDTVAPQAAPFAAVLTEEMVADAAFVAVPAPKDAASIMATGLLPGHHGGRRRRRRLADTLADDAARWKGGHTLPCTPLPFFYPTPAPPPPAFSLAGRVALVTGASCGIGQALAAALVAQGVTVVGTSRTPAAYPDAPPGGLLALDMASPTSVAAFAAALAAHPAVAARGGLDFAVLNAGRFALGPPGPPPLLDEAAWFGGMQAAVATNLLGPARIARVVLPLLEGRPRPPGDGYAPRLFFTASASAYATGGADPLSMYYWSYAAAKRAALAYVTALRAGLRAAGSGVVVSVLEPMAVNTRLMEGLRPTFLAPVDARGWPVGDTLFKAVLWLYRDGLSRALAPAFAARAATQLLVEAAPPADVVVGGWDTKPADGGRIGGQQDIWDIISQAEDLMSAFPFEAAKQQKEWM